MSAHRATVINAIREAVKVAGTACQCGVKTECVFNTIVNILVAQSAVIGLYESIPSGCLFSAIMPSSSDNQKPPARQGGKGAPGDAQAMVSPEQVELSQVYVLIDSILPFEACLYYQVLPLFIEGSRLTIGMVNPDDQTASEYVKKQLSYINYSIDFKRIQSDWHRDLLSKYLSHNAKAQQPPPSPPPVKSEVKSEVKSDEPPSPPARLPSPPPVNDRNLQTTFIVDQPDEIPDDLQTAPPQSLEPLIGSKPHPVKVNKPEAPAEPAAPSPPPSPTNRPQRNTAPQSSPAASPTPSPAASPTAPLHLQIGDQYRQVEDTELVALSPKALMQVLLSKVLEEGIGRLYFERRSHSGRILWSKDGILQAVVESIDPTVFQGVINEFKLLTHLSLVAVKQPRQVEIERLYEKQRILLRFRVMPNAEGEEATLQVLRGTALRFYQQQQIDKLGRDALDTAQRLQRRLNEIRDRARQSLNFKPTRSETLPAIIQLLKQMEVQVQEIVSAYDQNEQQNSNNSRKS